MKACVAYLIFAVVAAAASAADSTAPTDGTNPAANPDESLLAAVEALTQPSSENEITAPNSANSAHADKPVDGSAGQPIPQKRIISVPDQMDRIMTLHDKASRMKGDQTFDDWANEITRRSNETAVKIGSMIRIPISPEKSPKKSVTSSMSTLAAPADGGGAKVPLKNGAEYSPATAEESRQSHKSGADWRSSLPMTPNVVASPWNEAETTGPKNALVDTLAPTPFADTNSNKTKTAVRGSIPRPDAIAAPSIATPEELSPVTKTAQPHHDRILMEIERLVREQLRLLEQEHEQTAD